MKTTREAALEMARRGFRVFPLLPNTRIPFQWNMDDPNERNCSPNDRSLAGGIHKATRDETVINSWFDHELDPDFDYVSDDINYGVSGAGLVILDVDVKNNKPGVEDLLSLGSLPPTFTVGTTTGGMHLYFSGAEVGQKSLTKAIDIRSRGGYVVGPGSVIDGKRYKIIDDIPLATIPEKIFEKLKRAADADEKTAVPVTELDQPEAIEMAIAFLKREPAVDVGNRNNTAFSLACQLKDFGLSAEKIHEALTEHWNTRNAEPLPDGELQAVAQNAYKSGRYAPGVRNVAAEFEDLPEGLQEVAVSSPDMVRFDRIVQREASEIPPRPWLVPGLLIQSSLTTIVAQPGARKSTFTIGIAVGFALGSLDHMGFGLRGGARDVMIINNEDDEDEIDRRIAACCDLNGLDYAAAKKRIHLHKPPDGSSFVGMGPTPQGNMGVSDSYKQLKGYIKANDIGLVIFDPLADIHHAQENDNSEMAQVMSLLRTLIRSEKIAGLIVHHSRKPDNASSRDYAGDPFSSRGASAIHGNVRVLATLCAASEDDGYKHLGVSPPNHLNYCRFDAGKGSYSPPGKHTRWYVCEGRRVGPVDGDDTAPALKLVEKSGQVERRIVAIHEAICQHRDLFNKEGEMPAAEAADIVAGSMIEMTHVEAAAFLEALFREPRTIDGVTLTLVGTAKKAVLRAT
jgi:RecA-family ATPase